MSRLIFIVFTFFSIHTTSPQNSFQDIFYSETRPLKENLRIEVGDESGNQGYLPVSVLKGKLPGPTFTIVAGVHGFEYPPIVATQQLMQEIDSDKIAGTIIFIPIANRGSFYGRTPYVNPQDNVNLNNAFPGSPNGSITQQLAHVITEKIIPVTDVFLDIHGGDAPEDLLPFVCYYDNKNRPKQTRRAKELSETSGFEYVVSYPYTIADDEPAKYAFKQAVQDGKTGLSIECGKLGNVHEEAVALIKTGVYNMLAEMKMYDKGTGPTTNLIRLNDQVYIRSKVKGIFYSAFKAGDSVQKNEVVGYTTDEFGEIIEEHRTPKTGIILYNLVTPPINVGDTVMCVSSFLEGSE